MATLYYNGAVNSEWSTLGNWWTDSFHTVPASQLPTSSDDVFLSRTVSSLYGNSPTVANLSTVPWYPNSNLYLGIAITVTGTAVFNGEWYFTQTITGNVEFSEAAFTNWPSNYATGTTTFTSLTSVAFAVTSDWHSDVSLWIFDTPDPVWTFASGFQLGPAGNIHGNVIFNGSGGYNYGQITGSVTFNNSTYNWGLITGTATFNDNAYNNGTVTGNAEFTAAEFTSISIGSVSGTATFTAATSVIFYWTFGSWNYDTSLWVFTTSGQNWIFSSGSYNSNILNGDAVFNDGSFNNGTVTNDATFNGGAYNNGTVTGNAEFTAAEFTNISIGSVSGTVTFTAATSVIFYGTFGGSWNYDTSLWVFTTSGQNWIFSNSSSNSNILTGDAVFNDYSYNSGTIYGDVTFNSNSSNGVGGETYGDAVFNDSSSNAGTVNNNPTALLLHFNDSDGSTTFTDSSPNELTATANGSVQISTAQSVFGSSSAVFNGGGDNLAITGDWTWWSTSDYTIEFWLRANAVTGYLPLVFSDNGINAHLYNGGTIHVNDGQTASSIGDGLPIVPDTWTHIAIVRLSGTITLYQDGVVIGTTTQTPNVGGSTFRVGGDGSGNGVAGYIDEVRVVKGFAVYTSSFTPPTSQLGLYP